MDKNYISLELDKILTLLSEQTGSEDSRLAALALSPSYGLFEVNELLKETWDAHSLSGRFGSPPIGNIHNMKNALRRAEAGAQLTASELLKIGSLLRTIQGTVQWRDKSASVSTQLDMRFNALSPNKYLSDRINSAIISDEEIADNASPTLLSIRKKIASESAGIRQKLDKLIHSSSMQKYLQDSIITIRGGRFVIPVKAEFRSAIPGLVHDTSSSGATVFIEPMAVVEANNEIRILRSKEQAEIERILYELSSEAGAHADSIAKSYDTLIELDLIFAKARLAYNMKASLPVMNDRGIIDLKKARHPLIDKTKVVATDISLGRDFDTLIVTGPNTGGKTVSLKTVGLLSLMAMCGLMIPASDNSELSVFDHILSDIGDEQSIEQSLSTFSAHITNIVSILKTADDKSLVLIDELGSGTDPIEGAALATAILEQLRRQGARVAATTHYAELKSYAIDTAGVENACCEFDIKTLKPTYRLLIGMPGRSNAFAISERLGIDKSIIDRATELVSAESSEFESVVDKLEKSRGELDERLREAELIKHQAQQELEAIKQKEARDEKARKNEIELAKAQAERIISQARAQAYTLLDEIETMKKAEKISAEQKAKLKSDIRRLENTADPIQNRSNDEYVLPRPLKTGDRVLIFDIDKKADVLEVHGDEVLVQAGIIKTRVDIKNLRLLEREKVKLPKRSTTRTVGNDTRAGSVTEIDVRGENAIDAILDVDRAIDAAVLRGLHQITIIHGKGTGVLRKEIQAHLKKHPSIRSYRLGAFGEGDAGVTIAELK